MNSSLPQPVDSQKAAYWPQLPITATALSLAEQFQHSDSPLVVVMDSAEQAARMRDALRFFCKAEQRVEQFPDYETLPYDLFSPAEEIISERLRILYELSQNRSTILVTSITTLMSRLPPKEYVTGRSLLLNVGSQLNVENFRSTLIESGYQRVDTVTQHGEFAVRGSLMDLFPMGSTGPFRIDLFDDEVDSIRPFDPDTQLTTDRIKSIALLPAREYPLDSASIRDFQNRWHQLFSSDPRESAVYREIATGASPQGIECYLPLFFEQSATLFDYLDESTVLIIDSAAHPAAEHYWGELSERFDQHGINPERPLPTPTTSFVAVGEIFARIQTLPRILLDSDKSSVASSQLAKPAGDFSLEYGATDPYLRLREACEENSRVLICAESAGRREVLLETLARGDLNPTVVDSWLDFETSDSKFAVTVCDVPDGVHLLDHDWLILTEDELLGDRVKSKQDSKQSRRNAGTNADQIIRNLTELQPGSPVVHIEHGVGRFLGLETIKAGGLTSEYLCLEYADDNKLFVPISALNLISRYTGSDSDHAPMHRLGSEKWEKIKKKAREQIEDTAAELLDIYSRRMARQGHSFALPDAWQNFCDEFPFEETPDQMQAIVAVKEDMLSVRPMDRLVCGDVGFGKTEIAMRAAFIAAQSSKQILVLVPTTLLARQHYNSFRDRFANWPVKIESVSRLKSETEQQQTLELFNRGEIDILIGTHKLLHSELDTQRTGLLIVDEEHRFGVKQKEKLKSLKAEVDILTLTATPIPRTLNMAMAAIRDLSIISTPPLRRLAIKTFVNTYESRVVREAVLREMMRGGQIYFLHNEVKSIARVAEELKELIPEAKIEIAHGQMRERDLERIIGDFYHHRFHILLCTTIIETGIDIPNANTIVINRADKFGLAQLHQLRGRVGRSHHQAYAYLMTPDPRDMTKDAKKRLEAIQQADHLGCGFTLATHDLEIRGAGELLGDEQSGQIEAIGFELYQQMLDRAVKSLQSGIKDSRDPFAGDKFEINLRIPALIPDDYLPDVNMRLSLYKRISTCESEKQLRQLQVEMIDRFGLLPDSSKNLFRQTELALIARGLGVEKLEASANGGRILFNDKPAVEPHTIIELIQNFPDRYRLDGGNGIRFQSQLDSTEKRLEFVEKLLTSLAGETTK